MKAVIVKAHAEKGWEVGTKLDVTPEQYLLLSADEYAVTLDQWNDQQAAIKATERLNKAAEGAVDRAIVRARDRGAMLPKEDASTIKAQALKMELFESGLGEAHIDAMPIKASAKEDVLEKRITGTDSSGAEVDEDKNVRALVKGYLHANEPFQKELRNGGIIRACRQDVHAIQLAIDASRERAIVMAKLSKLIAAGADFLPSNVIKATTVAGTDLQTTDSTIGTLNTGLILQWNLGYLKNQLAVINDITTDISNQPVAFGQNVITRYLKVPGVQLKNSRTAGGEAWSGGSGKGAVDVNVYLDTHAGVPITFNENMMGSTVRQLFNEQKQPQLYGLGEYILYKLIYTAFNGSKRTDNANTGYTTITFNPAYTNAASGHTFSVAGATLATFVADLPEAMDESKMPGGDEDPGDENLQRFAWVHGRVYASATADTNYLINQSIWGAVARTGENVVSTGRFHRLGNLKFRKSQLMTDQITATGTGADGTTNAIVITPGTFSSATYVGLAGTRSSLLFVSRVPIDYTKAMPEIPSTAAIELVTEPDTGLTFMVVKYLDHAYETANMRVQLMFGTAIGDERQGLLLTRT